MSGLEFRDNGFTTVKQGWNRCHDFFRFQFCAAPLHGLPPLACGIWPLWTKDKPCLLNSWINCPSTNLTNVSLPLEHRILLQMDQTTSANQSLLRHIRERRACSSVDRHQCLPARGYFQKTSSVASESLHNSTDFECVAFRENPHFTGFFAIPQTDHEPQHQ